MTTPNIVIELKLEVIGPDTIIVPGCEPLSSLTSPTLARWSTCRHATVKLADAMAAIPGSRIEFQINNGMSNGGTKKWFILPPFDVSCPCKTLPDYYKILRDLEPSVEDDSDYSSCEVADKGFCPPSNFNSVEPPPVSPYIKEGQFYGSVQQLLNTPRNWSEPQLASLSDPYTQGFDIPVAG